MQKLILLMTTDEAFEQLLSTRGIYKTLVLHRGTIGKMKSDLQTGHAKITLDKKIELLQKAGYKIVQEMKWDEPSKYNYTKINGEITIDRETL